MIVLNYLISIILPFMVGGSIYSLLNKNISMLKIAQIAPIVFLFPNIVCYGITIYIFGEIAFNFTTGGNILVLKYSILNVVITVLVVIIYGFIEKTFELTLGVENEDTY